MTDDVRSIVLRLVDSMGHGADPDSFSDEDAWAFVLELREYAQRGANLPSTAVTVLQNLGAALGIYPGAPAEVWLPALEAEFGPSPHDAAAVAEVLNMVRAAVNGRFETAPARGESKLLGAEPAGPPTPLGNLDFGD